jgi:hypothetical protein
MNRVALQFAPWLSATENLKCEDDDFVEQDSSDEPDIPERHCSNPKGESNLMAVPRLQCVLELWIAAFSGVSFQRTFMQLLLGVPH